MKEDGILLLFLSKYKEENDVIQYVTEDANGHEKYFEGVQTNDAPVKYLISKAAENGDLIQKALCIITKEVKEENDHEKFEQMINAYIQENEKLKELYQNRKIKCEEIEYKDPMQKTSVRAVEIYRQISAKSGFAQRTKKNVYIDYTGGMRDISFLMTVIIRYLECYDIFCKEIVYSNKDDKKIYSLSCIYDMFQLLSGVDQFVSTGNAELLESCYQKEEDRDTKELLRQIVRFSHAVSLCDIEKVEGIMENLRKSLDQYEEKKERGSFFSEIFSDMIPIIRQKLNIEKNKRYTYPGLIRWCLDNNMVQQALTLYVEKMPQYYYDLGLLNLPEKGRKLKPGATAASTAFYEELYDGIWDMELKAFAQRLRCGYESLIQRYQSMDDLGVKGFSKLLAAMETDQEKRAVQRIISFLQANYKDGKPKSILLAYTEEQLKSIPNNMNGFVVTLLNDDRWQHYFLYKDKRQFKKREEMKTYEKKVAALDKLKEDMGNINIPESNVSNEELYHMMKYYLPLKMLRNQINHASEEGTKEDERLALERLELNHGICANKEFDNVKKLMYHGLNMREERKGVTEDEQ